MQYPLPHPHTSIQTPIQSTGPADTKLLPVRCGGVYEWCGLEGTILAMKQVGVVPATGQLEPAIWLGDGCNTTNNRTDNGWTPAVFKDFLEYLDEQGVRSVAIWTLPFIEMGPPTSNSTCTHWMLAALRDWIGRTSAASSRTGMPARTTRLKSDETDSRASVTVKAPGAWVAWSAVTFTMCPLKSDDAAASSSSGAPSRDPLMQPFASSSIWNVRLLMCPYFLDLRGAIRVANECPHLSYPSVATLCTSPPATAAPPIQLPRTATASATTTTLSC